MVDVCLINPPQKALREPTAYIPLGLAFLATCLEKEGIEVTVANLATGYRRLLPARFYGITCHAATFKAVIEIADTIKTETPESTLIIGGPQASIYAEEVKDRTRADIVIKGEAENLLPKVIKGEIEAEPIMEAGIITNLDTLPFPKREFFLFGDVVNTTGIHGSKLPSTTMIATRGCPFNCKFCCRGHPMFTNFRTRAPELIREELEYVKSYGVKHVRFVDDCFTTNRDYTLALCNTIKDSGVTFIVITRTKLVDRKLLEALKEAGCTQIDFGIESGSQKVLDLMNKRATVEQNVRAIELAHEAGISVKAFLMMNYTGETEDDREKTLEFIKQALPDDFTLSVYQPFDGSGDYFYPDSDMEFQSFKAKLGQIINKR